MRVMSVVVLLVGTIAAGTAAGQSARAAEPQSGAASSAQTADRVFTGSAGLLFSAVKKERVADFEQVLGRLRRTLADSPDPARRQQAEGWRMFKSTEPGPNGSVLYVFLIDPVVKGADYGVAKILAEALPEEIQELYKLYSGSLAGGQTLLDLEPVPDLPAAGGPAVAQPAP